MSRAVELIVRTHPNARVVGSSIRGGFLLLRVRAPGHEGSIRFRFDMAEGSLVQISTSDRKHGGKLKDERPPIPDRRVKRKLSQRKEAT